MRAAGYIRVSTEEQVRDGYGLAAQEQAVRAYCQARQWELAGIYSDAGRTGKAMRGRDGLARLLKDARARQFERVVFWKMDRLARNLRDLLEMCARLEADGGGIGSIQESIDTGTPTGRMMCNMLGSIAEFEGETIVERIKNERSGRAAALSARRIPWPYARTWSSARLSHAKDKHGGHALRCHLRPHHSLNPFQNVWV